MANVWLIVLGAALSFVGGLLVIIYNKHNKDIAKNEEEIKGIKEKYVTKEDFNRQNDKVDAKLDKIIDILMKRGHDET
jgi:hypothetical protein